MNIMKQKVSASEVMSRARMKRSLILHIGTEKTGSTTIQSFLRQNTQKLARQGIGVPSQLGETLHFKLQLMANRDEFVDDFTRNLGLHTNMEERLREKLRWKDELYEEVNKSNLKRWIISCETLHSRLTTTEELEKLKGILAPLFDQIRILIYLRNPIDLAVSRLTEAAKCAMPIKIPTPPKHTEFDICNHRQTIERWRQCMGEESLMPRLYDKKRLIKNSILDDFIHFCQIADSGMNKPSAQNPSMSAYGLKLLSEVNRHVPRRRIDGSLIKSRWKLVCHIMKHLRGGEKYQPNREEILTYNKHYKASNEWVRKNYFPNQATLFDDDYSANISVQSPPEEYHRNIEKVANLIAETWLINNAKLRQIEAENDYLKRLVAKEDLADPKQEAPSVDWREYLER